MLKERDPKTMDNYELLADYDKVAKKVMEASIKSPLLPEAVIRMRQLRVELERRLGTSRS